MQGLQDSFIDMEDRKMARYRVMEAKCGIGAGGMACGPVAGPVIGEIRLADENGDGCYLLLNVK